MVEALIKANEVEQLIVPIFGNKEISAIDKLYGILENTGISSYKFAENKKYEKELEEGKFSRNRA